MRIGMVAGTVVSTICSPVYEDRKLLWCDLLTPEGQPTGDYLIAVDRVDAGVGEKVLLIDEGNSARQVVGMADAPIRAVIVGIVDEVRLGEA
ncbi:MAG: EutN/CcmL family microcompartment protein [Chloroflexi bacterium]|nr:EutN/CcmL family microcompartment protein [Chloroflexota bacterium]